MVDFEIYDRDHRHGHHYLRLQLARTVEDSDFLIQPTTSLWRLVRKIGFLYKRTSKVVVPLDTSSFMTARVRYFASIDELRNNASTIFWYDET